MNAGPVPSFSIAGWPKSERPSHHSFSNPPSSLPINRDISFRCQYIVPSSGLQAPSYRLANVTAWEGEATFQQYDQNACYWVEYCQIFAVDEGLVNVNLLSLATARS